MAPTPLRSWLPSRVQFGVLPSLGQLCSHHSRRTIRSVCIFFTPFQVGNVMKRFFIFAAGLLFLGESMSPKGVLGTVIALSGTITV